MDILIKKEETMEHYRMSKIAFLVKEAEKVLDVGCFSSPNLYLENKEVIGLDLYPLESCGHYKKVVIGDAQSLPKPFKEESFDAITAGELIEHLENPMAFLRGCYTTLKNDGILVISTPNPNSIWERLLTLNLSRKYFYDSEHICLYPQRWIIRMFEICGFQGVTVLSGGVTIPIILRNIPFPRPWAEYYIVYARKFK